MLTLTEKAAQYIARLFEKENMRPPPRGIRFGLKAGGCSGHEYVYELIKNETLKDHVMILHGIRVIVDPKSMKAMEGSVIDHSDNLLDPPFSFTNSNAKSSCGCGASVELKEPESKKPVLDP